MIYEYAAAISYKSEIEEKATKLADFLAADKWNIFFAPSQQQELLSEKIYQKLYDIYKNKSLIKILMISDSYLNSEWTLLEKRVSLMSTKEDRQRLVIINYTNDIVLPGDLSPLQYLNGQKLSEDEIAFIVTERIHRYLGNKQEEFIETGNKKMSENKDRSTIINNGIVSGNNSFFNNINLTHYDR